LIGALRLPIAKELEQNWISYKTNYRLYRKYCYNNCV